MRVLIAGGGTGGHLFPGLAVAEALRAGDAGTEVRFVGTSSGLEARLVPEHGYPLDLIDVAGIKGRGLAGLRAALRLPGAAWQALRLLRRSRPDVVLGVGGYASGPVVLLAALLRYPTAILEQNSVPGITNRALGRVVDRVFIAFPEAASYFPAKSTVLVGNPIRAALIHAGARVRADDQRGHGAAPTGTTPRILVLGGSQGAHAVNELVTGAVEELVKRRGREALPRIRHQTGRKDAAEVRARYEALGLSVGDVGDGAQVEVRAFISDMAAAYAGADLIIGRAGATTLAELTALGLPALLIPFPFATDDHQTRNARFLADGGAARLLPQASTTPALLADEIAALCQDPGRLLAMARASRALGRPDAAAVVAAAARALASGEANG
jgi:UDP-N-acetylglucosamine--N-acetylmuramyl-(pentapeptide) pyrophosphoryl-undecaprenol N-acetylglucosamine transferase